MPSKARGARNQTHHAFPEASRENKGVKRLQKYSYALVVLAALAACQEPEPDPIEAVDGFEEQDPASKEPRAYGVVASDYAVTSIGLLKPNGKMLSGDFVHSGSAPVGLVAALSGDVRLPTRSGDPDILTIIDRHRSDVITRIDPDSGEVLGQVKTHGDGDAAYSSNPQDYVQTDTDTAWVSRFAPNLEEDEDHEDGGNDLLQLDIKSFERSGRISFWHLNGKAERTDAETGDTETVTTYARPSAVVRLGDYLVVGLANLSASFDAIGPGMVALVNPETEEVTELELPELQNCDGVRPVPGSDDRVVVACAGFHRGDPRASAGLVLLELDDDELSIVHSWHGADHPDLPLAVASPVPLGGTEVVAVAVGEGAVLDEEGNVETPETYDAAYVVDLSSEDQTHLFEAEGRYKIGSGAYNPERKILLLPDASVDDEGHPTAGVRRFERDDDGDFEALDVVSTHDLLPPIQVRPL